MTRAVGRPPRSFAGKLPATALQSRLALDPQAPTGSVAGSWSPRTRHPTAELTGLVLDLASRGVVATGLSVSVADWTGTPGRLHLQDRDVRLRWLAYGANRTVTVRHQTGQISLAIVTPDAPETTPSAGP